ncbi:hypothetical protein [Methylosinus trichosporium]|uniref:hypothetical protein n=1 Tax=Methylosinus trichosporium TaxID=426 RepID=UPI0030B83ADB
MVYAISGRRTGFIVDSVTEVLKIPRATIEPAPKLSAISTGFSDAWPISRNRSA